MTALLEHFDKAINTPGDVEKVKKYILQLAMQGKLVEQNSNDEPASELLMKIEEEKQRLIKEKKIKKSEILLPIEENEIPYQLPKGWLWVRLKDICFNHGQKRPDEQFSYIDVSSIDNKNGELSDNINILNPEEAPSRARKIVKKGTIIYSTVRPYLLNIAIIDRDFENEPIASTAFAVLHPFEGVFNKFLYHYLRSQPFIEYVESKMIGVAYPAINDNQLFSGLFPLPPINEQVRIVNKIEKLFEHCNQLSSNLVKKATSSVLLNKSVFTRLQYHSNPEQLNDLHFAIKNMEHLCNDRESINRLTYSILNLAFQGSLQTQDNKDKSISIHLKEIKETKNFLLREKKLSKDKTLSPILADKPFPYKLPNSWEWVRLQDIFEILRGASPRPSGDPQFFNGEIPWITVGEITKDSKKYLEGTTDTLTKLGSEKSRMIYKGELLLTNSGATLGVPKISNIEGCINDGVALLRQFHNINMNDYLYYYLLSQTPVFRSINQGMGQPNLNTAILSGWYVPLAPIEEQKRIVSKIEDLFSVIQMLERAIESKEKYHSQLIKSLVK